MSLALKARKIEIGTKAGLPFMGAFQIMQGLGIAPISSHQEWRNREGLVSIWRRGNVHSVSLSMSPGCARIVTTSQEHGAFLFCLLISQVP